MNYRKMSWIFFLLLIFIIGGLIWYRTQNDPCNCKSRLKKMPQESKCVTTMTIEDSTQVVDKDSLGNIIYIEDKDDNTFKPLTHFEKRVYKITYHCDEWILNGNAPNAAEYRDSLCLWGFCKVASCPCPGNFELWRYAGNKDIRGIDDTPNNGGEVVVDPKKKAGSIGGLELNYVIIADEPLNATTVADDAIPKDPVRSSATCETRPVRIAIVDSGVDTLNANLRNYHWIPIGSVAPPCNKRSAKTRYGVNIHGKRGQWEPVDDNGHGSHINGIITGVAPNGGDGMNVPLEILNVKVLKADNTSTLFDAMCGLYYALDQGAEIINVSWGFKDTIAPTTLFEPFLQQALAQNVLIVAGLGNDSMNVDDKLKFWPACFAKTYPNVISVGALDTVGTNLASFSNWSSSGDYMSVAASGQKIISAFPSYLHQTNVSFTNGLAMMSGTSMATPFVTRTAAVLLGLAKARNQPIPPDRIKRLIMQRSSPGRAPTPRKLNHGGMGICKSNCGVVQCPPILQ